MQIELIVINAVAAGVCALCLGILFTAPSSQLVSAFVCGMSGRLVRDLLLAFGWRSAWATALAAIVVVLAGTAFVRRREVSPVVVISGVLPLGATSVMFSAITNLMKAANLKGDALSKASDALIGDASRVFTTTAAIAAGIGLGVMTTRIMRKRETLAVPQPRS